MCPLIFGSVTLGVSVNFRECDPWCVLKSAFEGVFETVTGKTKGQTRNVSRGKKNGQTWRDTLAGTFPCIMPRVACCWAALGASSVMVHLVTRSTIAYCQHKTKSADGISCLTLSVAGKEHKRPPNLPRGSKKRSAHQNIQMPRRPA